MESREEPRPLDRDFETTHRYAEAVKEVAAKERLSVVDTWTALWNAAGKQEAALEKFLDDGLHLNGTGYAVCEVFRRGRSCD